MKTAIKKGNDKRINLNYLYPIAKTPKKYDLEIVEALYKAKLPRLFNAHFQKWVGETEFYSSPSMIKDNKNFLSLLQLGKMAIPYAIEKLKNDATPRVHFFILLSSLTNTNPIEDDIRGDIKKMKTAWIKWAKEQNIKGT